MSLGKRIKEARLAKGLSQTQLADAAGISVQGLGLIERGRTKEPANSWRELADALDIPREEFVEMMREEQRGANPSRPKLAEQPDGRVKILPAGPSAVRAPPRKIDVLGRVSGSPLGDGLIMSEVVDRTECPPWLDEVPHAYALFVTGESMVPRFMPGEMLFVHPGRQPARDDFVVVQIQPAGTGEVFGLVKQFVRHDKSGLILRQFYPQPEEMPPIPMDTVRSIHKVVSTRIG